jgi:hypothetical protein
MSASLIGRLGSSAFRLSTTGGADVTRGLVLLFGIGAKALPSWGSKTRWNDLRGGLADNCRQVQADMRTHLIHRPARDTIPPPGGARATPCAFDLSRCHAAASMSLVQRNSVPSTQIRCKITASRRARATIAFFMPRRLATCIAQALSQDHRFERSMLWAAS